MSSTGGSGRAPEAFGLISAGAAVKTLNRKARTSPGDTPTGRGNRRRTSPPWSHARRRFRSRRRASAGPRRTDRAGSHFTQGGLIGHVLAGNLNDGQFSHPGGMAEGGRSKGALRPHQLGCLRQCEQLEIVPHRRIGTRLDARKIGFGAHGQQSNPAADSPSALRLPHRLRMRWTTPAHQPARSATAAPPRFCLASVAVKRPASDIRRPVAGVHPRSGASGRARLPDLAARIRTDIPEGFSALINGSLRVGVADLPFR